MLKELRALVLGGAMAIGSTLAPTANLLRIAGIEQSIGPRRGKGRTSGAAPRWWGKRISTVSRHKRDPNSPVLAAAQERRAKRELKRNRDAINATWRNYAHGGIAVPRNLNPLYVNREV